ncbi:hypothetical protein R1flu_014495 [Riccia fluitans]|uniref:Uncharacterized protein n=1 Tax=Riccia fluitans TaxID=41844 RepID=A0ABD1YG94_9MARC
MASTSGTDAAEELRQIVLCLEGRLRQVEEENMRLRAIRIPQGAAPIPAKIEEQNLTDRRLTDMNQQGQDLLGVRQ